MPRTLTASERASAVAMALADGVVNPGEETIRLYATDDTDDAAAEVQNIGTGAPAIGEVTIASDLAADDQEAQGNTSSAQIAVDVNKVANVVLPVVKAAL